MCAKVGVRKEQISNTTEDENTHTMNWRHNSIWQWQREVGWARESWKRDAEFQSVTDIKKKKSGPV